MAIGRFATLDSSSVRCPDQPASTKPAVEWINSPKRPRLDLPSRRATRSSGSVTTSSVLPRTNSPGWRMKALSSATSTSSVRSSWFRLGSMNGVVSLRNTRKYRSTRRSTEEGWTSRSSRGSITMRPSASSLRMETSERITAANLLATGVAAPARLAGNPAADRGQAHSLPGDAPVEEALDQVDLLADRVVPPDLALHGLG